MCSQKRRGVSRESVDNLRRSMPLSRKLRLFVRNNWIKVRTRSSCCGNHGEPGC
jgi:hypothetical protein